MSWERGVEIYWQFTFSFIQSFSSTKLSLIPREHSCETVYLMFRDKEVSAYFSVDFCFIDFPLPQKQ